MENYKILVDEFENLQIVKKQTEEKLEKLRRDLINLAINKNTNFFLGTHKKCSIKQYEKVVYPENKEILIKLIREKGLYERFSSINYLKLNPFIIKGEIDKDILDLVKKQKDFRVSLIDMGV